MNFMKRIALSLSLIALIAQPAQAASYADHAKKAGRIAWHVTKIVIGAPMTYRIIKYHTSEQHRTAINNELKKKVKNHKWNKPESADRNAEFILKYGPIMYGPFSVLMIYSGVKGLHKEICPDFNPIELIKKKFRKEITELAD